VLVCRGLVPARKRKRRRQDYKGWQREEKPDGGPIELTGIAISAVHHDSVLLSN
jgi:hypothetical protein